MKVKSILSWLLIAISTMIFTACGGGSDDISTPSTNEMITGVWKLTDPIDSSDLALHAYLPDGTYYFSESNEINEGDDFEYGTYTFNNRAISVNAIIDTNANIGISSIAQPPGLPINLNEDTFTFSVGDSGDYTYTRQTFSSSSIAGVWQFDNVLFVFMDDGQYVGYQQTDDNDVIIGFEFGTYTYNENLLTISTLDNSDGSALLCDLDEVDNCSEVEFDATTLGDSLTISFPDFGDVIFEKIL